MAASGAGFAELITEDLSTNSKLADRRDDALFAFGDVDDVDLLVSDEFGESIISIVSICYYFD